MTMSDKGQLEARFNTLTQKLDNYHNKSAYNLKRIQNLIDSGDVVKIQAEIECCEQDILDGKKYRGFDLFILKSYMTYMEGLNDYKSVQQD